jgi:DNA-binding MarR family transcriptional regulator/GNAT superfamily N-acetyltransferase
MTVEAVAAVRRFNRAYTQRIGALDASFLGVGLPLGTARLLFEIGVSPGTVRDLRERLGLDSGYLSRLLGSLVEEGLVQLAPDPTDRRRRLARLTARGRRRWAQLEARSEERARTLIEPLSDRQRARLAGALAEAELLVRAATVSLVDTDPAAPRAAAAIAHYFDEIGERFGFDEPGLTPREIAALRRPVGVLVLAENDGAPVACGGVQTIGPGVGEIKRMWVDPAWRGAGMGSRLLRHLELRSVEFGHRFVRLDTNRALTEAIAMYERAGYRRIDRYNDNPWATEFFEKTLA